MMRLSIFLLLLTLHQCYDMVPYQATYYKNGAPQDFPQEKLVDLEPHIHELMVNADDRMTLIVQEELIQSIRKEEAFEVIFSKEIEVENPQLGKLAFSKLLIPLGGAYMGSKKDQNVTIFLGNKEGYMSSPIGCSQGYQEVKSMRKVL